MSLSLAALDRLAIACAHAVAARQPRADYTINQLPSAGTGAATDLLAIWRNGNTYQLPIGSLPTTLIGTNFGVFNVRTYGALGVGTDDTAAFIATANAAKAAIASAAIPGAIIFIPPGIYGTATGFTGILGSNIVLQGSGNETTILRLLSPTVYVGGILIDNTGAWHDLTITDLCFDLNGNTVPNTAIFLSACGYQRLKLRRCRFIGNNGGTSHQTVALGYPIAGLLTSPYVVPVVGASGVMNFGGQIGNVTAYPGATVWCLNGGSVFIGLVTALTATTVTVTTISPGQNATIANATNFFFSSSDTEVSECIFYNNTCASYGDLEMYGHIRGIVRSCHFIGHTTVATVGALFWYGSNLDSMAVNNYFENNHYTDVLVNQGVGMRFNGNTHRGSNQSNNSYTITNSINVEISNNSMTGVALPGYTSESVAVSLFDWGGPGFDIINPIVVPNSDGIRVFGNRFAEVYSALTFPSQLDSSKNLAMTNIEFVGNTCRNTTFCSVFVNGAGGTGATGISNVSIRDNTFAYLGPAGSFGSIYVTGSLGAVTGAAAVNGISIIGNTFIGQTGSGSGIGVSINNPVGIVSLIGNDFLGTARPVVNSNGGAITYAVNNAGYNYGGALGAPTMPLTYPVKIQNPYPVPVQIFISNGTATVTGVQIYPASGLSFGGSGMGPGTYILGPLQYISLSYTAGTPTWQWFAL